jgi:hypothetical protein
MDSRPFDGIPIPFPLHGGPVFHDGAIHFITNQEHAALLAYRLARPLVIGGQGGAASIDTSSIR